MKAIKLTSKLVFKKNQAYILICLICLLLPQMAFSQDIIGEWKCPDGMYQYWGYKAGKAHITFKKDNTFVLKVKGRNMRMGLAGRQRRMNVKVKGFYTEKKDSMYFYVNQKDIKCNITPGKEDPVMSPERPGYYYPPYVTNEMKRKYEDYEYYEEKIKPRTTWDGREVYYNSELRICDFQRIAIINQMLDFFECKRYSFEKISQDSLRLGKKFVITRPEGK